MVIGLNLFNKGRQQKGDVRDTLLRIRDGDVQLREQFLSNYKPFILKAVSRTSGRYVEVENSDEYSIGLMAFNEAVEKYNENKNAGFFSFAEQVIQRRVIDYIRSNSRHNKVYPFTYYEDEDSSYFEEKYLKCDPDQQLGGVEIKEQIELFNKKLGEFGITLEDLVLQAPKHRDSKQLCIKIAKILAANRELFEKLDRKKNIPMVELMKLLDVNQRTVERNRKFIIAVCLILNSGLDVLKSYVKNAGEGGEAYEL